MREEGSWPVMNGAQSFLVTQAKTEMLGKRTV